MRAGRLRHRVTIQTPTETRDSIGGVTQTWATHAAVWGSVEPLSGRELFAAQQVQATVNTKIVIRYLPTVTEKMRVEHVADIANSITNTYDIEAVIHVQERRRETQLLCVKRSAEGFRSGA